MIKTYKIEVDCAHCAQKMEDAVNKLDGVNKATINFLTQKLIVDTEADLHTLKPKIVQCIQKVDADADIYE